MMFGGLHIEMAMLKVHDLLTKIVNTAYYGYKSNITGLKTLSLEMILLLYIRAIHEENFQLYIESLAKIIPWMFALGHTPYSRWLPVHIRDMLSLSEKHPEILEEFRAGKFVLHKTSSKFSAMAIDQCHEQNNATVK